MNHARFKHVPDVLDRDQAILLASRVFAAFLLFWVVEDITELPREVFAVIHYFRESGCRWKLAWRRRCASCVPL